MDAIESLQGMFEGTGRGCTLGHEGLLTLARKVSAAAQDADPIRLEAATRRFEEGLVCHVRAEAASLVGVAPAEARIIRRGHVRLGAATEALLAEVGRGCAHSRAYCRERAEELVALLTLQVRDERKAARPPAG